MKGGRSVKFGAEVEQSLLINRAKFQESRRFPSEDIKCGPNVVTQVYMGQGRWSWSRDRFDQSTDTHWLSQCHLMLMCNVHVLNDPCVTLTHARHLYPLPLWGWQGLWLVTKNRLELHCLGGCSQLCKYGLQHVASAITQACPHLDDLTTFLHIAPNVLTLTLTLYISASIGSRPIVFILIMWSPFFRLSADTKLLFCL